MTITSLIKKAKFDWANTDINDDNFSYEKGASPKDAILFHPDKNLSTQDVLELIEKNGLRPATITELLEYAIVYPEQREFSIIELGSICAACDGEVVSLGSYPGDRYLRLGTVQVDWLRSCRFLAFLKSLDSGSLGTSDSLVPSEITIDGKMYTLTLKI